MWRDPKVGDRVRFKEDPPTSPTYRNKEGVIDDINKALEIAYVKLDDPEEFFSIGCNWDELEILFD